MKERDRKCNRERQRKVDGGRGQGEKKRQRQRKEDRWVDRDHFLGTRAKLERRKLWSWERQARRTRGEVETKKDPERQSRMWFRSASRQQRAEMEEVRREERALARMQGSGEYLHRGAREGS